VRAAPEDNRFHWSIGLLGWLVALSIAVIGGLALVAVTGYAHTKPDDYPLWLIAVAQVPLWLAFIAVTVFVSREWGTGRFRNDYGFRFRSLDLVGLPIGVMLQVIFVPALYWALRPILNSTKLNDPAKAITDKGRSGIGVVLLVVLLVLGAPIVEELFFRGMVLRSFQAAHHDSIALVASAVMFAAAHFQPLQFPGLVLFGLVVGFAAQRTGRLGLGIAIHMGFNATAVVNLLWVKR
jgi:uncharacterized protein